MQIWHHELPFDGQLGVARLVATETAVAATDSLHWHQPGGDFDDLRPGEGDELPVEEFAVKGLGADQMLDPRGPDVTGPNEVLVNIAKNVCSCAISEEH